MISIIVAVAQNGIIGGSNNLLWHISEDLRNFKRVTSGHPVIMGRKTFESLGKPLPNRENVVITRSTTPIPGCRIAHSIEEAIAPYSEEEEVFIIGGGEIYKATLAIADKLYITRVLHDYEGDTSFPEWNPPQSQSQSQSQPQSQPQSQSQSQSQPQSQSQWRLTTSTPFKRGEKYEYPFVIEEYTKTNTL